MRAKPGAALAPTRSVRADENPGDGVNGGPGDRGDEARRAILDVTLGCFAEFGWSGTNMSVIARRSRMTRGRIQYYFPTLEDLLRAGVDHLMIEWRKKYFAILADRPDTSTRFEVSIDGLWALRTDPLQIAKQELEASARTNPELAAILQRAADADDQAAIAAVLQAYPELGARGKAAVRLARDFTRVFLEGMSRYRFSRDADNEPAELIETLKTFLASYWRDRGLDRLGEAVVDPPRGARPSPPPTTPAVPEGNRQRALALLREAAELLSETATEQATST